MSHTIDHFDQLATIDNAVATDVSTMDVWVPGEHVSAYELEMPDVPERKWNEMIPWLLEDQLLRPIEELHFVMASVLPDRHALVFVVSRENMNRWLMMAESKSVNLRKIAPDYLALPLEDGYWTMSIVGDRMLVRTGQMTGFAAEVGVGWQLLELELAKSEDVKITGLVESIDSVPESWQSRIHLQEGAVQWAFTDLPESHLLTGDYRPKRAAELKPWLPAISTVAFAVVLMLTYMVVQSYKWGKEIAVLEQGVAEAYQDIFKEVWRGDAADIRRAADNRIELLNHQYISLQSPPLYELRALDAVLSACPACDIQTVKQTDSGISVTIGATDAVRNQINRTAGIEATWRASSTEGVFDMTVSAKGNSGG